MRLKTRIKEYRLKRHMNQQELADIVGVRRETISHLERGTYNPSLRLAWDLAKVLDVPIEQLFQFEEEES